MEETAIRTRIELSPDAGKRLSGELQKQVDKHPVRIACAIDTRALRVSTGAIKGALKGTMDAAARVQKELHAAFDAAGGKPGGMRTGLEGLDGTLKRIEQTIAQVQPQVQTLAQTLNSGAKTSFADTVGTKLGNFLAAKDAYRMARDYFGAGKPKADLQDMLAYDPAMASGTKGAGRPKAGFQDMPAYDPAATRNERAA